MQRCHSRFVGVFWCCYLSLREHCWSRCRLPTVPSPGSAMGPWPLAEESSFLNALSYICRTTMSEQVHRGLPHRGARVWVLGLEMDMGEQSIETTKAVLQGEPTAWHGAAVGISCCLPCPTCRSSTCNKHGAGISLREICGLNIY